ncbi:MAG: hypothetical protein ACRDD2_11095 [Sarcina sp.]
MLLTVQIIAIIFMVTFIFIGIWSFIIFNRSYSQLKYKNYILEKIEQRLSSLDSSDLKNSIDDLSEKALEKEENILEALEVLEKED